MINIYYYKLEEAEKIKETYSSWIGKEAHVGRGVKDKLKTITIEATRNLNLYNKTDKFYKVEFKFEKEKSFSAHEFLFHNSLITAYNNPYFKNIDIKDAI